MQLVTTLAHLAQSQGLRIHYQHQLTALTHTEQHWQLTFNQQPGQQHATVVLANGHQLNQFDQTQALPVSSVRGQLSLLTENVTLSQIKQVICFSGYLTPSLPSSQQHCLGASYLRGDSSLSYRQHEQHDNRQRLVNCFAQEKWLANVINDIGEQARVSIRCTTRDHLPMVGAVANYQQLHQQYSRLAVSQWPVAASYANLYMIGALGARGLTSAPLTAELLAAQIFAESLPLSSALLNALNPNRFWIRKLAKGKML